MWVLILGGPLCLLYILFWSLHCMCARCHNLSLKSDATYKTKEIQAFEVKLFAKSR